MHHDKSRFHHHHYRHNRHHHHHGVRTEYLRNEHLQVFIIITIIMVIIKSGRMLTSASTVPDQSVNSASWKGRRLTKICTTLIQLWTILIDCCHGGRCRGIQLAGRETRDIFIPEGISENYQNSLLNIGLSSLAALKLGIQQNQNGSKDQIPIIHRIPFNFDKSI